MRFSFCIYEIISPPFFCILNVGFLQTSPAGLVVINQRGKSLTSLF